MIPFWLEFPTKRSACLTAASEQAALNMSELLTGERAHTASPLPYPAEPQIGEKSTTPAFCYTPSKCKNRGSCPQELACND